MNPHISQKVRQIAEGIEDLKMELLRAQEQMEKLAEARNELQKKFWAQAKELAVYKERLDEVEQMRAENERLVALTKEFGERLHRILEYTERLEAEFQA